MSVKIEGYVSSGYEHVADAFVRAFKDRPQMGAALSIRRDGTEILSLWGGIADERTSRPWTKATPSVVFSCTKGLVSVLAAMLVEKGRLDYSTPVAQYWPEFAAAGKGDLTVAGALAHRAGLPGPPVGDDMTLDDILDWTTVTRKLAAQAPLWPPGSGYFYHAITHGWIAGEVIRRITGKSVGAAFAELIAAPLDASAWIGLSDPVAAGVAHLQVSPELAALWQDLAAQDSPEAPDWSYRAMTLGTALPGALVKGEDGFNDPRLQAAEVPGAGGIASAEALAAIWSATVADTEDVRLLHPGTVAAATKVQTEGPPVFLVPPPYSRWGMGFQLDSEARRYLGPASFGHDGAGGQVGFADPEHGIGFAFVTNWLGGVDDERATDIIAALRASL